MSTRVRGRADSRSSCARINPDSIAWQEKLDPHKAAMEQQIASARRGALQACARCRFQLPDFIDVVLNAGDQRKPLGATIGQSPAQLGTGGRGGRPTTAMTNLYTDPDSIAAARRCSRRCSARPATPRQPQGKEEVLESRCCTRQRTTSARRTTTGWAAEHHRAFGGPLLPRWKASKAQNSSLYLLSLLQSRGALRGG